MGINFLIGLSSIIFLGVAAQWIAWRWRLPSILLLLLLGFAAGPVTGFINPDEYFGKLLFPIVSMSVAVILFEGGLNLKFKELKDVGTVVRNLITAGILITWVLSASAAYFILNLDLSLSILFGAILVVTGPTVILPILRHVKPTAQINSVLKWEGIVNDPIGAVLAILVFEFIISPDISQGAIHVFTGLLETIIISTVIGLVGTYLIVLLVKYNLMPDFLLNPVTLATVVAVFASSNIIQQDSGLFAVTVMGVSLANQKSVTVKHIIEFKENLRVLLISVLFILLAARLKLSDLYLLNVGSFIFVALLIIIIRPVSVLVSSIRSKLNWKERFYLSWMAPRGIVAAAVTSIFAIELGHAGQQNAAQLVPLMFLVIVATISIYGLSAIPLANWLGIANPNPQGCLILGAHPLGREIGNVLQSHKIKVRMVDTNWSNISSARMKGLPTFYGNILSDNILDDLDLTGIGRLLAITPNHEVNSLATLHFSKILGSRDVYQLSVDEDEKSEGKNVSIELRGKILFGSKLTYQRLLERFNSDMKIKAIKFTKKFGYGALKEQYNETDIIPLFLLDEDNKLDIITKNDEPGPEPGEIMIALVNKNVKIENVEEKAQVKKVQNN